MNSDRVCNVDQCDRPVRSKGMCGLHYDRVRAHGTTELPERAIPECSVAACDRPAVCKGMCKAHDIRRRRGVPLDTPFRPLPTRVERDDIVARILASSRREGGCLTWTGYALKSGYGTISWGGRSWVVHRAMWTATVGPIPTGDEWTIDHLCRNRLCVNIDHLEVVTRGENSRRGGGLERARAVNANGATCRKGLHPWTPENIVIDKHGVRRCLTCKRDRIRINSAKLRARRRAAT